MTKEKRAAYNRAYFAKNREKLRADARKDYAANREARVAQKRAYNAANKEKVAASQKATYAKNPRKKLARTASYRYGITPLQVMRIWDSPCEVCGATGQIHVDHDHLTGRVRGGLCRNCNIALGHVQESVTTLRNLIKYLERGE